MSPSVFAGRKGNKLTVLVLAFLMTQISWAQDEPLTGHDRMLSDTLTEETYHVGGLTFTVETQKRFKVVGEALVETQEQWIITPFGTEVEGMPSGLGCERWESWDKDRCKVRGIVESGPDIFLITTGRIYTYVVRDDAFFFYGEVHIGSDELRVGTQLKGAENVFLLTQSGNDPIFVGLLVGYEGVWSEVELPAYIDLNETFKIIHRGSVVIFRFGLFRSMKCDLATHACTTRGIKTPE